MQIYIYIYILVFIHVNLKPIINIDIMIWIVSHQLAQATSVFGLTMTIIPCLRTAVDILLGEVSTKKGDLIYTLW